MVLMIHKVDNAMSLEDVAGGVLIIPSQSETVPRNPHKQVLLMIDDSTAATLMVLMLQSIQLGQWKY